MSWTVTYQNAASVSLGTGTATGTVAVAAAAAKSGTTESRTITVSGITGDGTLDIRLPAGTAYTDPGAMATDAVDGDLTARIQTDAVVNTTSLGDYTVIYTVTDTAGNTAHAQRTVKVITAPAVPLAAWPVAVGLLLLGALVLLTRGPREG